MLYKVKSQLLIILLAVWFSDVYAQEIVNSDSKIANLENEIPLDPKVVTGKLENGLTYYIRKNSKPENKIELQLAVNIGSILENEEQLGLAHFLEHMAFNGTKNFKKNDLVSYLQSVGVKFGTHLNAYTSFDETVYMLSLPTDDDEVVDKGFQIFEDWAQNISLEGEEIDKERGVVLEELRLGQGASQRMREKWFPVMMKDSRYAERLPIGKKEVIENFKYETIIDFYETWYRPEFMAVVVVGDLDVKEMEEKIKKQFGPIPASRKTIGRPYYDVPLHKETLIATAKDKEETYTRIQVFFKRDKKETKSIKDYGENLLQQVYDGMLNQRLSELTQKADPPFLGAGANYGSFVRTKDIYFYGALVAPGGVEKGLTTLIEESRRVLLHGFTQGELDRYKQDLVVAYERAYNERDKTESKSYASEYVSLFLEGVPSPGIENEMQYLKALLPTITLEKVNALTPNLIANNNRVVVITGPDQEGIEIPSEEEISSILEKADALEPAPYEDKLTATALMEELPTAGKLVAKEEKALGVTEIKLSNGVTVVLKPTDFKNDQIIMDALNFGGHSLYGMEDYFSAEFAASIVSESGVKDFSVTDIQKLTSGKIAYVSPYIREITEGFRGSCTPKDLETMMQLLYLNFTAPRKDEEAFTSLMSKIKSYYANVMANPDNYFADQTARLMSQNHPRGGGFPTQEDFDKVDLDRAFSIYQERFADAQNFTFFFIGNFEVDAITPLLQTYLGSLPTNNAKAEYKDVGVRFPKGVIKKAYKKGTEAKSQVKLAFTGDFEYDRKEAYKISSLAQILQIKLTESLREDESGVYGVSAFGYTDQIPFSDYYLGVEFPCGPENVERLINAAIAEIKKLQDNGPTEDDLNKIKETQKLEMKESLKKNEFWLSTLRNSYLYDRDYSNVMEYEKRIDALTIDELKETANKYYNFDNYVQAVLYPEGEE